MPPRRTPRAGRSRRARSARAGLRASGSRDSRGTRVHRVGLRAHARAALARPAPCSAAAGRTAAADGHGHIARTRDALELRLGQLALLYLRRLGHIQRVVPRRLPLLPEPDLLVEVALAGGLA